jgi:L-malate glycosyltransferase
MKILLITESRGWSGGAAQTLHLATGLKQRNHTVHIACQPGSEISNRAAENGIPTVITRIRGDMDLLGAGAIRSALTRLQSDILHAQHPKAHGVGLWAAAFSDRRLPYLVTRRVSFPVSNSFFSRLKYTHRRIDRYVAVSDGIRQVLIEGGVPAERIEVIYSGVDPERFKRLPANEALTLRQQIGLKPDVPVVIKVANYAEWKGQPVLLRAAAAFRRAGGRAQFLLVGRDTDGAEARALIEQLGLKDNVISLGFRRDIADLLSIADLSVNAAIAGEGLSGALRESLLLGVPSVASDVSGNRELVQEGVTGKLVPTSDPDALAGAIRWMFDHPDQARQLTLTGQQKVMREFTVETMVNRTLSLYQRLLSEKGIRAS